MFIPTYTDYKSYFILKKQKLPNDLNWLLKEWKENYLPNFAYLSFKKVQPNQNNIYLFYY